MEESTENNVLGRGPCGPPARCLGVMDAAISPTPAGRHRQLDDVLITRNRYNYIVACSIGSATGRISLYILYLDCPGER
jgi:hypothetical protein